MPATPRDRLLVEDLAATMLVNSRVAARAATSVYRNGATLDLGSLPEKALEETTGDERLVVAHVIGTAQLYSAAMFGPIRVPTGGGA